MKELESVDLLVRIFARSLSAVWKDVSVISQQCGTGSYLQDWLQANWEMIVEAGLKPGIFLEVYGEGADCNSGSSRVYRPDATATHAVHCVSNGSNGIVDLLSGREIDVGADGLPMDELVAVDATWYARKPPFDCALVETEGGPFVFPIDRVAFCLRTASRG